MPQELASFETLSILRGNYVALLGGCMLKHPHGYCSQDCIYLYSVHDKQFQKSRIKCPELGYPTGPQAVAVNDPDKDKLATFGFIRNNWTPSGMKAELFPPEHLIKIICDYYINEYVHLFRYSGFKDGHFKIDIFELFQ